MKIVFGHRGENHVTSNDFQGLAQSVFGSDNEVFNVGQAFGYTLVDVTEMQVRDGEGVLQGVHFRIPRGEIDTITLPGGRMGYNKICLVCARYTKDADTGVENVDWYVHEGTEVTGTPEVPTHETGDVLGGDTVVDFPMYQVTYTGVTPTVSVLFNIAHTQRVYNFSFQAWETHRISVPAGVYAISGMFEFNSASIDAVATLDMRAASYTGMTNAIELVNNAVTNQEITAQRARRTINGVLVVDSTSPYIDVTAHINGSTSISDQVTAQLGITRLF